MRKHVLSIGIAMVLGLLSLAACGPAADDNPDVAGLPTVGQIQDGKNEIPNSETMTKEEGQAIALEFVKNSPTFKFDGMEETLALVDSVEVSMPGAWTYELSFESRHAGYGDRADQMLAQVITPHTVSVSVEQGKVVYASMDNKWDMLHQEELFANVDPNSLVEEPDITGLITDFGEVNSDTASGRILVELERFDNTSDKYWVTVDADTPIFQEQGLPTDEVSFGSLTKGQTVGVWFDGPVAESYPAQVKAKRVHILISSDYDSFVTKLRDSGANVEHPTLPEVVVQDFFSVTGQVFKVNGEDVQVYEYDSQLEAEVEAATVSPSGSPIGTYMVSWMLPPHFYQSGDLIVIYLGLNQDTLNLLEDILGPQFAGQ